MSLKSNGDNGASMSINFKSSQVIQKSHWTLWDTEDDVFEVTENMAKKCAAGQDNNKLILEVKFFQKGRKRPLSLSHEDKPLPEKDESVDLNQALKFLEVMEHPLHKAASEGN